MVVANFIAPGKWMGIKEGQEQEQCLLLFIVVK